jgi:serine phosphatase RsbU (regulator of sigma subunit)
MSNQFIMFTDGLTEATSCGEAFGEKRLLSILRETKEDERLNNIQLSLADFLKGSPPQDDISIVTISCS